MKNILKILGIIALVAVIGFTMAACGDGGDNGGGGGGGGNVAWADLVGEWSFTSGSNSAYLQVNPVQNATIGGVINASYNVDGSMGGGTWIQCSISGTTLKIDNGEKTFTISLSSDKKTLTLSNSSRDDYKRYEGVYTKEGGEQPTPPTPPNPPATSLVNTTWKASISEGPFTMNFTLTFIDATRFTMVDDSGDPPDAGTYSVNGNTVSFISDDQGPLTGTLNGNKLTVSVMGMSLEFTKQ
jgi:hypothetical protein